MILASHQWGLSFHSFFLVKASGNWVFYSSLCWYFFWYSTSRVNMRFFLIHVLSIFYRPFLRCNWFFSFPCAALTSHPVNVGSHHLLPLWFIQAFDLLLISNLSLGWLASHSDALHYFYNLVKWKCKVNFFVCVRPSTSDVLWAGLLVLHFLLWAEPAGRGDLPRLATLADGGRLYRPFQLGALLSGPAVQREPQLGCGAYAQTYWYDSVPVGSAKAI